MQRRRILAMAGGGFTTGLAGCTGGASDSKPSEEGETTPGSDDESGSASIQMEESYVCKIPKDPTMRREGGTITIEGEFFPKQDGCPKLRADSRLYKRDEEVEAEGKALIAEVQAKDAMAEPCPSCDDESRGVRFTWTMEAPSNPSWNGNVLLSVTYQDGSQAGEEFGNTPEAGEA